MNEVNKKPGKRLENSYFLSYNSAILSDFLKKLHHNVFFFFFFFALTGTNTSRSVSNFEKSGRKQTIVSTFSSYSGFVVAKNEIR